jgi:hypothetical protein
MNARVLFAVSVLSSVAPAVAAGQGTGTRVSVQGAVGTDINAGGDSQSVSIGFSPNERLDILVSAERFHWPTEVTRFDATDFSATRGGTTTFISGEVRFLLFTFNRISPYVLASAGRGISRPNVNDIFPDRVTNDATLLFFGGGVRIAVTERLNAFADIRFGIQGERDSIIGLAPVRGGVAWRF